VAWSAKLGLLGVDLGDLCRTLYRAWGRLVQFGMPPEVHSSFRYQWRARHSAGVESTAGRDRFQSTPGRTRGRSAVVRRVDHWPCGGRRSPSWT